MTVIELPKSSIVFEIGGKKYILSLADKTINQINKKLGVIQSEELKGIQKLQESFARYNEELEDLKAEANIDGISDAEFTHQSNILQNKIERLAQAKSEKSVDTARKQYMEFLNTCFGDGAGKELYKLCDSSTTVLGKVVTQISIELNNEQNIGDYRQKLLNDIGELRDEQPDQSDSTGEQNLPN